MLLNNEMQPQTDSDVFKGEGSHGQQHRMRQVPQVSLSGSCKLSRTERREPKAMVGPVLVRTPSPSLVSYEQTEVTSLLRLSSSIYIIR